MEKFIHDKYWEYCKLYETFPPMMDIKTKFYDDGWQEGRMVGAQDARLSILALIDGKATIDDITKWIVDQQNIYAKHIEKRREQNK